MPDEQSDDLLRSAVHLQEWSGRAINVHVGTEAPVGQLKSGGRLIVPFTEKGIRFWLPAHLQVLLGRADPQAEVNEELATLALLGAGPLMSREQVIIRYLSPMITPGAELRITLAMKPGNNPLVIVERDPQSGAVLSAAVIEADQQRQVYRDYAPSRTGRIDNCLILLPDSGQPGKCQKVAVVTFRKVADDSRLGVGIWPNVQWAGFYEKALREGRRLAVKTMAAQSSV